MSTKFVDHETDGQQQNVPKNYALSGKIMLSAIIILFVVVILMVILHIFARWYLLRIRRRYLHRRRSRRRRATHIVFYIDPNIPSSATTSVPARGLDASVLSSLPVFKFSSQTHPDGLDCAVCLSEFEENESGRMLPKCNHSFHSDCIDMWFHSHSTCPICRAPVESDVPGQTAENNRPETVLSIDEELQSERTGSGSGFCSTCNNESGKIGTSTTSLADRRKGLDLVRVDVPRRSDSVDELRLSSPSHGFRSPGSRLQSLKRILSMNRKSAVVSPSSGIGTSSGPGDAESDIELGKSESTQ